MIEQSNPFSCSPPTCISSVSPRFTTGSVTRQLPYFDSDTAILLQIVVHSYRSVTGAGLHLHPPPLRGRLILTPAGRRQGSKIFPGFMMLLGSNAPFIRRISSSFGRGMAMSM